MPSIKTLLTSLAFIAVVYAELDDGYSKDTADQMGPAAFMWPKDRVWSGAMDNTAPCGSAAKAQNRSEFPLTNGKVALVDQDEGWNLQLGIAYVDEPTKDTEFDVLIDSNTIKELDRGHTCLSVPDAPNTVSEGKKATLQIKYTSDMEDNKNETYYACADIQYVRLSNFDANVPCFNATNTGDEEDGGNPHESDGFGSKSTSTSRITSTTALPSSDATSDTSTDSDGDATSSHKSGDSLSGGAIAGIVIGSLAGAALLVGAGIFVYRRKQQRTRASHQQSSSRDMAWEEATGKGRTSSSTKSFPMNNLNNNSA